MTTQIRYGSASTYYQGSNETSWSNLGNLYSDNNVDAGTSEIASASGTRKKPGRIQVTGFGYALKPNAKINSVKLQWEERITNPGGGSTGLPNIPSKVGTLLYANGGSNSGGKTHDTNVPNGRTYRELSWALSEIANCKPAHINSGSFGVFLDFAANTAGNTGYLYLDYMRAEVDFTDPTYSLGANIDAQKVVGENVVYTLTITNTNNCHHGANIPISITLPPGLSYVSQSGNGTYNTSTSKWDAVLSGPNGSATLNLVLNSSSVGTKTVNASVDNFNTTIAKSTSIISESYTLSSTLQSSITQGADVTFTVTANVNSSVINSKDINVPVIPGFSFKSSTGSGSYNSSTGVWGAQFTNQTASRTFVMTAINTGTKVHDITAGSASLSKSILVLATGLTTPFNSTYALPEEIKNYLTHGDEYTISVDCKVNDTTLTEIYEGLENFKIAVLCGSTTYLGTRPTLLNEYQRIYASFIYDENNPPVLKLNGQYPEISPSTCTLRYGLFAIHQGADNAFSEPLALFDNPSALISEADMATAALIPNSPSASMLFKDINMSGREQDPNLIVKGIGIKLRYDSEEDIGLYATLKNGSNSNMKSILLSPSKTEAEIGGSNDLWGFDEISLNDLSFLLEFQEISGLSTPISVGDVSLVLYYQYDETGGNLGYTMDDVHSRNYNIFLQSGWDKPEGLELTIDTYKTQGHQGELIIGSGIDSKEIKVPFIIVGNNLEEIDARLKEAVAWMSPEFDEFKRPIPKKLIFDWDKNREYHVILKDAVKGKYSNGTMECDASFLLPEGVAIEKVISGAVGKNTGLTRVRPAIKVKANGGVIKIKENISGTTLFLNENMAANTILIFNCDGRIIYNPSTLIDISNKVTLDSDWPVLESGANYDFSESEGCIIQTVEFDKGV